MTHRLAENIRAYRKARLLTQEQLAEVLGVSAGAVYKWEARLSQPELSMLMELADFFDVSVDALLGYAPKDNRLPATVARLKQYRSDRNSDGLAEAEKALKKYPDTFEIVYNAASLYRAFGVQTHDTPLLRRALDLTQNAQRLLPQNADPEISESTLGGEAAAILLALDQPERAVTLLKSHNAGGMFNDRIGSTLAADCGRPDEALPFLSRALLQNTASLIRTAIGYLNVYLAQKDYAAAQAVLEWSTGVFSGLKNADAPCFLDKVNSTFLACLAHARLQSGDADGARAALLQAQALASGFDAAPDYRVEALRFVEGAEPSGVYDDLGATASEALQKMINSLEDSALSSLWKELRNEA